MPKILSQQSAAKRASPPRIEQNPTNLAELVKLLGRIPLDRIQMKPPPGKAREADLLKSKKLCELVEGTLVEKSMGVQESRIAFKLGYYFLEYLETHDFGFITGPDGPYRMKMQNVRMPDVAYTAWSKFPSRAAADEPSISPVSPSLVVEVLSESNTKKEIEKKLLEYLESGVELIWIVDPKKRLVTVHRLGSEPEVFTSKEKLSGEKVLPGFKLEISKFL
jgi:Uma2 family endonuclease